MALNSERSEARSTISSLARLPRGSQGKRDPLFAINLSSLVGVRLDDSALLGSEECRLALASTQGPEEMCLSLEHQNPSKTIEKMGYLIALQFRRYTFYIPQTKETVRARKIDTSCLGRPSGDVPCASEDVACG